MKTALFFLRRRANFPSPSASLSRANFKSLLRIIHHRVQYELAYWGFSGYALAGNIPWLHWIVFQPGGFSFALPCTLYESCVSDDYTDHTSNMLPLKDVMPPPPMPPASQRDTETEGQTEHQVRIIGPNVLRSSVVQGERPNAKTVLTN